MHSNFSCLIESFTDFFLSMLNNIKYCSVVDADTARDPEFAWMNCFFQEPRGGMWLGVLKIVFWLFIL